jgi:signal transduction histidine kinase
MARLTIRARVALWYSAFVVVMLLLVAVAITAVYEHIGRARIDTDVTSALQMLDGVVVHELGENADLAEAAHGALNELELPGVGMAILDPAGTLLATAAHGVLPLTPEQLRHEPTSGRPRTPRAGKIRIAAAERTHGPDRYVIVVWTSLGPFEREASLLRNTMLISIPIAAVLAMVGGWLLARHVLRPLTAMAAEATAIDHHGLDRRLVVPGSGDELGQVAVAFNAVLDRLAGIVRAQRQFMADASHELRTPVSIARTAAQVTLGGGASSEDDYRESLDIIADQMQRVTRMVDDMFLLALADLDARPLDRRDFYLNEVVTDCVRAGNVLAAASDVTIEADVGPVDVAATGDEGLVRQMVMNLLDNAIRHAPAQGRVMISLTENDGLVEVAVEDSGPGIPAAAQHRVFDRFVRLDAGGPGAGLGLSIAIWIAEQHGWHLRVDGRGATSSRFVLTVSGVSTVPLS